MSDKSTVARAYRHLYRNALLATHRATPAKHVIRATMRTAFRTEPTENFNLRTINNTEEFLKRAKEDTGMEHRVLKNLLHVRYWQHHARRDNKLIYQQTVIAAQIRKEHWAQFDATLASFNDSMDLCLR